MYTIETQRLGLRNWLDSDLAPFAQMCGDEKVMKFFPSLLNLTETEAMVQRIKKSFAQNGFGLWALELKPTHTFIGFTGLSIPRFESHFTPCVEIGWRLAWEHWGKGYATEAALACLAFGFKELRLPELVSFTSERNIPSIRIMQRIGMQHAGSFEHPLLEKDHWLRTHVLYRMKNPMARQV